MACVAPALRSLVARLPAGYQVVPHGAASEVAVPVGVGAPGAHQGVAEHLNGEGGEERQTDRGCVTSLMW